MHQAVGALVIAVGLLITPLARAAVAVEVKVHYDLPGMIVGDVVSLEAIIVGRDGQGRIVEYDSDTRAEVRVAGRTAAVKVLFHPGPAQGPSPSYYTNEASISLKGLSAGPYTITVVAWSGGEEGSGQASVVYDQSPQMTLTPTPPSNVFECGLIRDPKAVRCVCSDDGAPSCKLVRLAEHTYVTRPQHIACAADATEVAGDLTPLEGQRLFLTCEGKDAIGLSGFDGGCAVVDARGLVDVPIRLPDYRLSLAVTPTHVFRLAFDIGGGSSPHLLSFDRASKAERQTLIAPDASDQRGYATDGGIVLTWRVPGSDVDRQFALAFTRDGELEQLGAMSSEFVARRGSYIAWLSEPGKILVRNLRAKTSREVAAPISAFATDFMDVDENGDLVVLTAAGFLFDRGGVRAEVPGTLPAGASRLRVVFDQGRVVYGISNGTVRTLSRLVPGGADELLGTVAPVRERGTSLQSAGGWLAYLVRAPDGSAVIRVRAPGASGPDPVVADPALTGNATSIAGLSPTGDVIVETDRGLYWWRAKAKLLFVGNIRPFIQVQVLPDGIYDELAGGPPHTYHRYRWPEAPTAAAPDPFLLPPPNPYAGYGMPACAALPPPDDGPPDAGGDANDDGPADADAGVADQDAGDPYVAAPDASADAGRSDAGSGEDGGDCSCEVGGRGRGGGGAAVAAAALLAAMRRPRRGRRRVDSGCSAL
jgi:hypothetical protein